MLIPLETILKLLPHRSPMLFLDRVEDVDPLKSGVGVKLVTGGEEITQGFLPGQMAFPGVLTIEMMAQTAAVICAAASLAENDQAKQEATGAGYLVSVDSSFDGKIMAGDVLRADVSVIKAWGRFIMVSGKVSADDTPVGQARLTIASA